MNIPPAIITAAFKALNISEQQVVEVIGAIRSFASDASTVKNEVLAAKRGFFHSSVALHDRMEGIEKSLRQIAEEQGAIRDLLAGRMAGQQAPYSNGKDTTPHV